MKQSTTLVAAITVFSCVALLSMATDADAGRFRSGTMMQSNVTAQPRTGIQIQSPQEPGLYFVDANGDGICDNTGLPVGVRPASGTYAGQGLGFIDANGDGINDNFIDLNSDGICDRFQ